MTTRATTTPRIYVASLSDYNAGRLHGVWIDCDGLDADDILEEVSEMLKASKEPTAEEWAIHDHEGFGDLFGEHESFETVAALSEAISEHGEAFIGYAQNQGVEFALADFEDAYLGEWDSFRDFAYDYVDNTGMLAEVDEGVARYFDYEAFARDLEADYITHEADDGRVYVYGPC